MLDKYNTLPYNYQSKIGYGTLIQNVTLKEMIHILANTIVDKHIELKIKNCRKEYLESKFL